MQFSQAGFNTIQEYCKSTERQRTKKNKIQKMTVQDRKQVKKERQQQKTVQDKKEKNIVRKTREKNDQ